VIINAHNFSSSSWTPAVNGKMPIHAWVPTRSGTAEDVVGSNDGTLTNGASIITDTDSGGAEAFSLDGSNDYVDTPAIAFGSASWSCWLYHTGANGLGDIWSDRVGAAGGAQPGFIIGAAGVVNGWWFYVDQAGGDYFARSTASRTSLFPNNTWTHIGMTYDTSTGDIACYVNGVNITAALNAVGAVFTGGFSSPQSVLIGARPALSGRNLSGRGDDFRIWDQVLSDTDMSDLYTAQRGGQA
jgi:hypothetical protein